MKTPSLTNTNLTSIVKIVLLGLILGLGIQFLYAWTVPTDVPPNGNVEAPVTVSNSPQVKKGPLAVNHTGDPINSIGMVVFGKLGVGGIVEPQQALEVNGNVLGDNIRSKVCPDGEAVVGFDGAGDIICKSFTVSTVPPVVSVDSSHLESEFRWCDDCDGGVTHWYYEVNLFTGVTTCIPQNTNRWCNITVSATPVIPSSVCDSGIDSVGYSSAIYRLDKTPPTLSSWFTTTVTQQPSCSNGMVAKIEVKNKTGGGDDPGPFRFEWNVDVKY